MVAAKPSTPLERIDGLIGKWVEEPNRFDTATVVYTIRKRQSRVYVTGVDESDGIALKISRTEWDGRRLRFVSLSPPTKHRAAHEYTSDLPQRHRYHANALHYCRASMRGTVEARQS